MRSAVYNCKPESILFSGRARQFWCLEYDMLECAVAKELQLDLVQRKISSELDADVLMLLQHPSVFTMGRRAREENLLISAEKLQARAISVHRVERGGDITYHGPGQIVAYPIMDLRRAKLGIKDFVYRLEEVMLAVAAEFGVWGQRNPSSRGIWVDSRKLGSLGIAVKRGISYHGLALNANTCLEPFSWINPCGIRNIQMTSLSKETGQNITYYMVKPVLKKHFKNVMGLHNLIDQPIEAIP